jgi:putative ATPase
MNKFHSRPWADLVRPQDFAEIIGQEKLLGKNKFLFSAIEGDHIPSLILWGPPGSGKTSLAHVIALKTSAEFVNFSAAVSGIGEIKKIAEVAIKRISENNQPTILFIDEIHRFNKRQQDVLLPYVEKGILTLIGATTENPSFEINSALLSRTKVFILQALDQKSLRKILARTLQIIEKEKRSQGKKTRGKKIKCPAKILDFIATFSNGDARVAINALQLAVESGKKLDKKVIEDIFQKSCLLYDKGGEEHYNLISALHKSMRGGNASAALYWLTRMIKGGEDPLYIARRLVRFASEDIGMANNSALMLAVSAYQACHFLGLPECDVHLAHCVVYLTKSAKNVSIYKALGKAKEDVKNYGNLAVPFHLRNASTKLMRNLGYGRDYKYSPDYKWQEDQQYFPDKLKTKKYF